MLSLGLDLSLRRTGWAVLDGSRDVATIQGRGLIEAREPEHDKALAHIATDIQTLLGVFHPDMVFVEVPGKMNKNRRRSIETVITLSEALGVVKALCSLHNTTIRELDQALVKETIDGYREAAKERVALVLDNCAAAGRLRNYTRPLKKGGALDDDLSDAVAIGWAGIMRVEYERQIGSG